MSKQVWEMKQEINYLKQELNRLKYHIQKVENNFREQFEPKYEKKVEDKGDKITLNFKRFDLPTENIKKEEKTSFKF